MQNDEIKEEVYKCSKCALCRGVCPVFTALKNEIYLPRGRFNVLNNFFNFGGKISKKFINDLDVCLNCGECTKFCPSSINSAEIFTELKSRYYKPLIPFYIKYKYILLMHAVKRMFSKDKFYKPSVLRKKTAAAEKKADIVYFQGCLNKYINPSDKNASLNLLEEKGYNTIKVLDFCCGLPYLSDGNFKRFEKNAAEILKAVPKHAEYIVTSCSSCAETLKKALKDNRIINLFELAAIENENMQNKNEKTVFYKPVSMSEYKGSLPLINKKGRCSLMENYFLLKHPDLYKKILDSAFFSKDEIEGKTIVTSCALSKWGLIEGCREKGINAEILSFSEYNTACKTQNYNKNADFKH